MEKKVILFQGDSITDAGRNRDVKSESNTLGNGYVNMIGGELCYKKPYIQVLNRGLGGDRIADMYGRWQEDTLNIKYDVLNILCGINDTGFGLRLGRGSDIARFEFIYDRMIFEAKEANPDAKLILCQPFILRKDMTNSPSKGEFGNDIDENWEQWCGEIEQRAAVVEKLAKKYNAVFVRFWDALKRAEKSFGAEALTFDCIHLTPVGNYVIAREWFDTVGDII